MSLYNLIPFVCLFAAWGVLLLVCPVTIYRNRLSANAHNIALLILMRRGVDYPAAVWAQEYYEARFRLVRIWYGLWQSLSRICGWHSADRRLELMGHAVELEVMRAIYKLQGADYQAYFWREVRSMQSGYAAFREMSEEAIAAALTARQPKARAFVRKHLHKIRKHF